MEGIPANLSDLVKARAAGMPAKHWPAFQRVA